MSSIYSNRKQIDRGQARRPHIANFFTENNDATTAAGKYVAVTGSESRCSIRTLNSREVYAAQQAQSRYTHVLTMWKPAAGAWATDLNAAMVVTVNPGYGSATAKRFKIETIEQADFRDRSINIMVRELGSGR